MARPEPRSSIALIGTGLALLVLLGLNIGLSFLLEGRPWALLPMLAVALVQAVLVAVYLMNLLHAGRIAWIYVGTGIFLLAIATLTLTDYFTRASPFEDG